MKWCFGLDLGLGGIGPFTTARRLRRPDGSEIEFSAWHQRKGHGLVNPADTNARGVQWWAPDRRGWWIAVLFMFGSLCFALGAFPPTASALLIPAMRPEPEPHPALT